MFTLQSRRLLMTVTAMISCSSRLKYATHYHLHLKYYLKQSLDNESVSPPLLTVPFIPIPLFAFLLHMISCHMRTD